MNVQAKVSERYAKGAQERQEALCCPVSYDPALLKSLPQEIIDKDYGCGDPSRYVRAGDTVLDLGSGGGKVCYMAAQIVGEQGAVIGIDMTDEMLALANKYKAEMANKLGGNRVDFRKGYIQDLALDVSALETYLSENLVASANDLKVLESWKQDQRQNHPLIASNSVDLVISNCVLNLVDEADRKQMISEIFRVLKPGGRVAISDIVSDDYVPKHMKADEQLWSGCVSGAFQEKEFLDVFADAGFVAVRYDKWDQEPWQTVETVEFRSVTIVATKPSRSGLVDNGHAVIYRGPYKQVHDDLGNYYPRGERIAVSLRTYQLLIEGPYSEDFIGIEPAEKIEGGCFCLPAGTVRSASTAKGAAHAGASKNACC